MIPEYLFKQAEREANAAMMKEIPGNMEQAIPGLDPNLNGIDPEVSNAIATILNKLRDQQGNEKDTKSIPDDMHQVEKASSLKKYFNYVSKFY